MHGTVVNELFDIMQFRLSVWLDVLTAEAVLLAVGRTLQYAIKYASARNGGMTLFANDIDVLSR